MNVQLYDPIYIVSIVSIQGKTWLPYGGDYALYLCPTDISNFALLLHTCHNNKGIMLYTPP